MNIKPEVNYLCLTTKSICSYCQPGACNSRHEISLPLDEFIRLKADRDEWKTIAKAAKSFGDLRDADAHHWKAQAEALMNGNIELLSIVKGYREAERDGRVIIVPPGSTVPTPDELEQFVRCEKCIHGGWTDDVTTHCNLWHTRDDPMCVGYLRFCGAGTRGKMMELEEAGEDTDE